MRARRRVSHAVEGRAGYTLIEILVALIIGAVVIGALLQMISSQGRYVEGQSALEEVQQNSRVTLELIGSELRGLPSGGALVRADADSLTIRSPRIWGSICAVTGPASIDVAFPSVPGMSFTVNSGTGAMVNLGHPAAPDWSDGHAVNSIGAAASSCGAEALPSGVERRSVALTSMPGAAGSPASVGNVVYVYDQVTYRTGTSAGVSGRWIQRRIGSGATASNQPMAGPVADNDGLQFSFYANGSDLPLSTPLNDETVRDAVSRIELTVRTVSRNGRGEDRASRTDTIMISLRNRVF